MKSGLLTLNYLSFKRSSFFFSNKKKNELNLIVKSKLFYFYVMHLALMTNFYTTQLIEGTAYEVPSFNKNTSLTAEKVKKEVKTVLNYIFYTVRSELYLNVYVLSQQQEVSKASLNSSKITSIESVETLYNNANWIEREISEMLGILFQFKNDTRNLLLMYGDILIPMLKLIPTGGFVEYLYIL